MKKIFMRYPNGRPKALTLSYDDGVEQDIELVARMKKYGVLGTFNLNSGLFAPEGTIYKDGQIHRRMTEKMAYNLFTDSGMEVAVHSLTHPQLEKFPPNCVLWEVISDRSKLEKLFGTPIHGMAYPFGTYNDMVVEQLKNAGIWYSRTTVSTGAFRQPTDWLRLPATCHHKNPSLMELNKQFLSEIPKSEPALFYLWGHSYEFEADNNWQIIEDFLSTVSGHVDIWYATNTEIYTYTKAYEDLDFNIDCDIVTNPSALSVWISYDGEAIEIKSGQTIRL